MELIKTVNGTNFGKIVPRIINEVAGEVYESVKIVPNLTSHERNTGAGSRRLLVKRDIVMEILERGGFERTCEVNLLKGFEGLSHSISLISHLTTLFGHTGNPLLRMTLGWLL